VSCFVDSSILIESLVETAPHHHACSELVDRATDTATHCLAETFNLLTGGRLGFRVDPGDAAKMIRRRTRNLRFTSLSGEQMLDLQDTARRRGARGGAIYDLIIIQAARLSGAKEVWTLNHSDFVALAPDLVIQSP